MIKLYLGDCQKALNEMGENQFDLAICDPEYGINEKGQRNKTGDRPTKKWKRPKSIKYKSFDDSKTPNKEYFKQLLKISKNQIIWGGNYFTEHLPKSKGWIVWDKKVNIKEHLSMAELAWSSFDMKCNVFYYLYAGFKKEIQEHRFHVTQKPVKLYKWLLKNYGFNKDGTKRTIVDTHFGSLSIGIACADLGFDLDAWEIDSDYFQAAVKRLHNHVNQLNAFVPVPEIEVNGHSLNEYMKQMSNV